MKTKYCNFCKRDLPYSDFQGSEKTKLSSRCRSCISLTRRKQLKNEKCIYDQRIKRFGITAEEHNALRALYDNKCAICGNYETAKRGGVVRDLSIDHCHDTGKVRGLLCHRCNTGLGYFNDDTNALENAITYLNRFR